MKKKNHPLVKTLDVLDMNKYKFNENFNFRFMFPSYFDENKTIFHYLVNIMF